MLVGPLARPGHPLLASGLSSCLPDAGRRHTQLLTRLCLGTCPHFCLDCPTHLPACLSEGGIGAPRLSKSATGTPAPCSVGLSADLLPHSVALVPQMADVEETRSLLEGRGVAARLLCPHAESSWAGSLPMGGECVVSPGEKARALSPRPALPAACSEAVTFTSGGCAQMRPLQLLAGKGSHQSLGQPLLPRLPTLLCSRCV